jgi:hypothetical protein
MIAGKMHYGAEKLKVKKDCLYDEFEVEQEQEVSTVSSKIITQTSCLRREASFDCLRLSCSGTFQNVMVQLLVPYLIASILRL